MLNNYSGRRPWLLALFLVTGSLVAQTEIPDEIRDATPAVESADSPGETMYVTDKLFLGLYDNSAGRGNQFKVIPSGTRLEVLERENRYARVRTEEGDQGWVKSQFLVSDVPALVEIEDVRRELEDFRSANTDVATLRDRNQALDQELQQASEQLLQAQKQAQLLRGQLEERTRQFTAEQAARAGAEEIAAEAAAAATHAREQAAASAAQLEQSSVRASGVVATARRINRYVLYGVAAVVLLALGFLAGYKWLDHHIRRQHGGFRVW